MSSFHAHTLLTYLPTYLPTYLSVYLSSCLSVCLSAYLAMYQFDRHFFGDYCVQGFVGK